MKNVCIVVQARMGSSRLPGKILKKICQKPMLELQLERLKLCKESDSIIVASSTNEENAPLAPLCDKLGIQLFRGSEDDVLSRYVTCAHETHSKWIVRVTGDCPLVDPSLIDLAIKKAKNSDFDIVGVGVGGGFPRGLDCEVIKALCLFEIQKLDTSIPAKEHVTWGIYQRPDLFNIHSIEASPSFHHPEYRLCVDETKDFELIKAIYERLYQGLPISLDDVFQFLKEHPKIAMVNREVLQKTV